MRDLAPAVAFYRDRLGFQVAFESPAEDPFFAIVERDDVRLMLKAVHPDVPPTPNPSRHPWARWDAFVHTADPDALAMELESRGLALHSPLADTADGLRGFEVRDPDGYVLFVGRPIGGAPGLVQSSGGS